MTTDQTLNQILRHLVVDEQLDPEVAADKAIESVSRAKLAEFVRPLVVSEARHQERLAARHIENVAFSRSSGHGWSDIHSTNAGGAVSRLTTSEARQQLVSSRFVLPNGEWIAWGAATAEDHRSRAEWQRGRAASIAADAERHDQAAALIVERGVSCLDDIDGWAELLKDAA